MKLHFYKLDGAGNDFVGLDWRGRPALGPGALATLARSLCDRNHGVGADGLLLLDRGVDGNDFSMKYVNANGTVGEMCGNGARCIAVFAHFLGVVGESMAFKTDAGVYRAQITPSGSRVEFPDVQTLPVKKVLENPLHAGREVEFLQVGVPHSVLFVEDLDLFEVDQVGKEIRHDPAFEPAGTNVNFAQVVEGTLHVRTYERGVEAETLACGTGSVATACCLLRREGVKNPSQVSVVPTGGQTLTIHVSPQEDGFAGIALEGPAKLVFEGFTNFEIDSGLSY